MLNKYLLPAVAAIFLCGACDTTKDTAQPVKAPAPAAVQKTAAPVAAQPAKKAPSFNLADKIRKAYKPAQPAKPVQMTPEQKKIWNEYNTKLNELTVLFNKKEYKKAIGAIEAVYRDAKAPRDLRARAAYKVCEYKNHNNYGDTAGALASIDEFIKDKSVLTSADRAGLLRMKANILRSKKENQQAVDTLMLRLAEDINDGDAFNTKCEIINIYASLKKYEEADALTQELFVTEKLDEKQMDNFLRSRTGYNREMGKLDEVDRIIKKRLELQKTDDAKAAILMDQANWLNRIKKNADAAKIFTDIAGDAKYSMPVRLNACINLMNDIRNNSKANKRGMVYVLGNTVLKDAAMNPMKGKPAFADSAAENKARANEDLSWIAAALKAANTPYSDAYIRSLCTILSYINRDLGGDVKLRSAMANYIIAIPEAKTAQKTEAYTTLYNIAIANAEYDTAMKYAEIVISGADKRNPDAYAAAIAMKAGVFTAKENAVGAAAVIRKEIDAGCKDRRMYQRLIDVYNYFQVYDKVFATQMEAGFYGDALSGLNYRNQPAAIALAEKWVNDKSLPEKQRVVAMQYFLGGSEKAKAYRAKYPDLLAKVYKGNVHGTLRSAITVGDYDRCLALIALLDDEWNSRNFECVEMTQQVYAVTRKDAEMAKLAKFTAECPNFKDEQKLKIAFGAAFAVLPDKPGVAKQAFAAYKFDKAVTQKNKADLLIYAGSLALNSKKFTLAKEIYQVYEGLFKPEPKKTYTVVFSDEPIRGLAGFTAMKNAPAKQLMDRKYGGNMDFLVTDVSTGNRGSVGGATGGDTYIPSEMQMACDEYGLHMLFTAYDSKSKAIEAGLAGAGSFEMYFAPGENQPYMCFLPDLTTGSNHVWQTTYNNAQWTRLDGKADLKSERIFTKDGYQLYMFFPWTKFYDKLPEDGYCWEFENIHWSRFGGYSWNGIKTIHGRSTWGKLAFSMTPAQVLKIKQHIIYAARQAFNAEKRTSGARHGVIDKYANDPLQGDPEFYKAKVAPIVDNLNALQALVKEDMDAATINKLYREAVPGWFNIGYIIEDLHRRYLEEILSK